MRAAGFPPLAAIEWADTLHLVPVPWSERVRHAKRLVARALSPTLRLVHRVALESRYRSLRQTVAVAPLTVGSGPVVAVFPHVDDETIAAGGILSALAGAGVAVDLVYTTDSSAGGAGATRAERAARRRAEAERVADAAGLRSVTTLSGINERLAEQTEAVTAELAARLRRADYQAAFVVGPVDAHHEHRTSSAIIAEALQQVAFSGPVYIGENSTLLPPRLITHAHPLDADALRAKNALFRHFASQTTMGFEVYHDLARAKRWLTPGAHAAELFCATNAAGLATLCADVAALDPDRTLPHRIGNTWTLGRALRMPLPPLRRPVAAPGQE